MNYPGGDTIGIVTKTPTADKDSLNQVITTDSVVWIFGCVFEPYMYGINEHETDTVTSQEKAYVYLPYTATTAAIDNGKWIRPQRPDPVAERDYKVFGKSTVQYDIDGQPDHVLVVCEWRGG